MKLECASDESRQMNRVTAVCGRGSAGKRQYQDEIHEE